MGWVQTSSATSPTTGRPCSFHASTAWFRVPFEYGSVKHRNLSIAETSSLAAILRGRYGWQVDDLVYGKYTIHDVLKVVFLLMLAACAAALAIQQKLAPDSLDLALCFNNLAEVSLGRGKLVEAQRLQQAALAIRQRLAPGSLDLAGSLYALGTVAKGDPARGAPIYARDCAKCHGEKNVRATAVHLANAQFLAAASDAFLRHAIASGRPGTPMESFVTRLKAEWIDDVVAYIRGYAQGGTG